MTIFSELDCENIPLAWEEGAIKTACDVIFVGKENPSYPSYTQQTKASEIGSLCQRDVSVFVKVGRGPKAAQNKGQQHIGVNEKSKMSVLYQK